LNAVWASGLQGAIEYTTIKSYIKLCDKVIQDILKCDPEYVGLSYFTQWSIPYGNPFLKRLRRLGYNGKIVIGGPGVTRGQDGSNGLTSGLDINPQHLLDKNLIDYYVTGDGEVIFEKILKQELPYPGVNNNNHISIANMDSLHMPNFQNFKLEEYPKMFGNVTLGIEGSRGCVRNCGFCDIKVLFLKYRYKSGQRLFDEIINNVKTTGVNTFWFTDSLVNGNQREFRKMLRLLGEYNNSVEETKKIRWTGQYIIRPQNQYIEEDFELLVNSGCYTLATGIESYSERVRKELGKNFSNDDIRWFFSKCQQYNINLFIMMVIGYPTETEIDFKDTLNFFDEFEHLADDNTITGIQLGATMIMIPGTPAWHQSEKLGITYDSYPSISHPNQWRNENSDIKIRLKRRLLAQKYALKKGFGIRNNQEQLNSFKRWMHDF